MQDIKGLKILFLFVLYIIFLAPSVRGEDGKFVFIVTSPGIKPYSEVVKGIESALKCPFLVVDAGHNVQEQPSVNFPNLGVITIGEEGYQKAMELFPNAPKVVTYMLNGISCFRNTNISCKIISLLPDPKETFSILTAIFPDKKKVGVVYGKEINENYRKQLEKAAHVLGISIVGRDVKDAKDALRAGTQLAQEADAFLFLPFPVFTPSVQALVYEAFFFQKKPVIGFTHKSVRDGALFSAIVTNKEIGAKAAEIIQESLEKKNTNSYDFIYLKPDHIIFNENMVKIMGVPPSKIKEIGAVF